MHLPSAALNSNGTERFACVKSNLVQQFYNIKDFTCLNIFAFLHTQEGNFSGDWI